jgi:hypothetical protein
MVNMNQAIRMAIHEIVDRYELNSTRAVMRMVLGLCYYVIGPLLLGLLGVVTTYQILKRIERILLPPPVLIRYEEAIDQYRRGKVREALKEFRRLQRKDGYGPAVLSLAAHEIYVSHAPAEGLRILREANAKVPAKPMKSMQEDARAILAGNAVMVDMNARLAKQQYLGISTI